MPIRVRQHVNPLAQKYKTPATPLEWDKIYKQPYKPLLLDIGCAKGQFLLQMAQIQPNWNFLGLEIREPLVQGANKLRDESGLTNLHYVFCNVNNSLRSLLSTLPQETLQYITIQFPDPWFKTRHAKRRVVQPKLVAELAEFLNVGGMVFLQSDMKFIAVEMRDRFAEHPAFVNQGMEEWLSDNPLPVSTEREILTQSRDEPVYRALFMKCDQTQELNHIRNL
jgi:tRNA (guanine-N7-)-methyltransferase